MTGKAKKAQTRSKAGRFVCAKDEEEGQSFRYVTDGRGKVLPLRPVMRGKEGSKYHHKVRYVTVE